MKNYKNNIIAEKYRSGLFGSWTEDKFADVVKKMVKNILDPDELTEGFNGQIVPAKWFNWKNVFKDKLTDDKIKVRGQGQKNGCIVTVEYNYELTNDEFNKFVYGDESNEEIGGIIYNLEFRDTLREAGVKVPPGVDDEDSDEDSNENEDENEDEDEDEGLDTASVNSKLLNAYRYIIKESEDSFILTVKFEFYVKYQAVIGEQADDKDAKKETTSSGDIKLSASDYLNPNYISSFDGKIFFRFNGKKVGKPIGTIVIKPKRTKDMNKQPTAWQKVKNAFKKTLSQTKPTDFGVSGELAKQAVRDKIVARFITVQKQKIEDIDINGEFSYTKNYKSKEAREKNEENTKGAVTGSPEHTAYIKQKLKVPGLSLDPFRTNRNYFKLKVEYKGILIFIITFKYDN